VEKKQWKEAMIILFKPVIENKKHLF